MYCNNCGKHNIPNSKFCQHCGSKIVISSQTNEFIKIDNRVETQSNLKSVADKDVNSKLTNSENQRSKSNWRSYLKNIFVGIILIFISNLISGGALGAALDIIGLVLFFSGLIKLVLIPFRKS